MKNYTGDPVRKVESDFCESLDRDFLSYKVESGHFFINDCAARVFLV